jgi:poly-gamma-glutamate capsule biosynthesis protein CapA/YwtB (metallophosphatase superfamily)
LILKFYTKNISKVFNLTKNNLFLIYVIKNLKNNFIKNLKKIIIYKKKDKSLKQKIKNITKNSVILKHRFNIKISIKKI